MVIAITFSTTSLASAATVTLAWDASSSTAVTGYFVKYGRTTGNYTSQVNVGLTTTATLTLPDDGGIYFIVVQAYSATTVSAPSNEVYAVTRVPTASPGLVTNRWKADFSGTGASTFTGWDSSSGIWRIIERSPTTGGLSTRSIQWGAGYLGDRLVSGDFDGDGRSDIAVWRPGDGYWYILRSSTNFATPGLQIQWGSGAEADVPVPGDYDGDGRTDIAVWRPGSGWWYVKTSSSNFSLTRGWQWGAGALGDIPVPGDYDGDSRTDLAVWRPDGGIWYVRTSSTGYASGMARQWGAAQLNDQPVVGDFDGDGRTDFAVWRPGPGTWFVLMSSSGSTVGLAVQWGDGVYGDVPVPNDYDGDGVSDLAVWRPSTRIWYVRGSRTNFGSYFGVAANGAWDTPLR